MNTEVTIAPSKRERWVTVHQVVEATGMSRPAVLAAIKRGSLQAEEVWGQILIDADSANAMLAELRAIEERAQQKREEASEGVNHVGK